MNRALKRWLGYADDDELLAARRKALAELPPPPPPPEPVIRQPVQEIIRRMLEDRPVRTTLSSPLTYTFSQSHATEVAGVHVYVKQLTSAYSGTRYSGRLTYGDHTLIVTEDEAEALYGAFTKLQDMDHTDAQVAAREAISAHLGVSTTQPT